MTSLAQLTTPAVDRWGDTWTRSQSDSRRWVADDGQFLFEDDLERLCGPMKPRDAEEAE